MTRLALLYCDALRRLQVRQLLFRTQRVIPPTAFALFTGRPLRQSVTRIAAGLGADRAPQSRPSPPPHATGVFTAFGVSRQWGAADFWTDQDDGLLFLFHLHAFTGLADYAASDRRSAVGDAFWAEVIEDWLVHCTRPRTPAWHPYPTSGRLIAWAAALARPLRWDEPLRGRVLSELWRQARYLSRRVEHDIGGNHVIRNARALAFAGATVGDARLQNQALRLLERELAKQVLPDGGHAERSPAYHRVVRLDLGEVAELQRRQGRSVPHWLDDALTAMERWERQIAGPDGRLPLFNDAWTVPSVDGPDRRDSLTHLAASGFVVFRHGADQAIIDVGPLSAPYLPPHAHADALSFVLWADGIPIVVDPGAFAYTGPERDAFRATRAHSTVEVDGRNQCVFWGDFRYAYEPRIRGPLITRIGDVIVATAEHDGYRRLPQRVQHRRSFVWIPGDGVIVLDRLIGEGNHRMSSRLPLAADAKPRNGSHLGPFTVRSVGGTPDVRPADLAPWLGARIAAWAVEDRREVAAGEAFGWSLLRSPARIVDISRRSLVVDRTSGERVEVTLVPPDAALEQG